MRKLFLFSTGFALAATIGIYFLQDNWYFLAAGIASACLGISIYFTKKFSKLRIACVIFAGCLAGFSWMTAFEHFYLSVPRTLDERKMTLTVIATDYSQMTEYGSTVEGVAKLNGKQYKVNVYLPEDCQIQPGDSLTGRFALRTTLPGYSGESQYSFSRGIFLTAKITRMPVIEHSNRMPWFGYPALVRQSITNQIYASFPKDTAGFAVALLIGDTAGIDYKTDAAFKVSGIRHIVAVSGFHVTILFSMVHTLMGKKRVLSATIELPVLVFFAAIAGFSPSISRACLMHGLMIIASLAEKEYDPLTALGFAVLSMTAINPWTVANVSFQLSVMCMLGIILFSDKIKNAMLEKRFLRNLKGKIKKTLGALSASIAMSVGATVLVTPFSAVYFNMVSLVGVITNMLTLWVVSIIFYGIIAVCIGLWLWPALGAFLAKIISVPIRYLFSVSGLIAEFPLAAVFTDSVFVILWLIFVYALLLVNLLSKRKKPLLSVCCAIIGLCIAILASWTLPFQDECRMTVLDVGQGQCILLQSEGKTYMVDCGGESDTEAADIAANALFSQGVYRLDGVILTHLDSDHSGGVSHLLERIPTDMIFLPRFDKTTEEVAFLEKAEESCLMVNEILYITFGDSKITIIPSKSGLSDNEAGLCILFQTENCDILITGDRSAAGERALMRDIDLPELEVLVVGHHGSRFSTGNALLELTTPEIAIISVGEDNTYGHPAAETLERLEENGCVIYRTDQHGTVTFRR